MVYIEGPSYFTYAHARTEMEHTEADRPPCTPAPYHSAKGLELPDWNAGFRLSSPTFSRGAPVRTPMRLGPPQVALTALTTPYMYHYVWSQRW